jgi:hypothetical protein
MQRNPGKAQRRDRTERKVRAGRTLHGKPQFREKKPAMMARHERTKTSVALAVSIG